MQVSPEGHSKYFALMMSKSVSPWVLLVEDDPIFSMLFCRFWRARNLEIEVHVAKRLAEAAQLLEGATSSPRLCIFDRNLPDGDGHLWAGTLAFPTHCWSATGEAGGQTKPEGKAALERVVEELVRRAAERGDAYPPSEGSTRISQE